MRTTTKYNNWIYLIWLPVIIFIAIEWLLGWPIKMVSPQFRQGYYSTSFTVAGILLFAAFAAVGVNYRHHRKLPAHVSQRRLHMVISILFVVLIYVMGKLLILGGSLSPEEFHDRVPFAVNFALLEQLLPPMLILFFLFQVVFALNMKRALMKEIHTGKALEEKSSLHSSKS